MKSERAEVLEVLIISILVITIVGLFALVGYQIKNEMDYGIKEGTVIDKTYRSAYTSYIYINGMMIPQYHGESWQIKIQKDDKELWITVDELTYHDYEIGDYYPKVD